MGRISFRGMGVLAIATGLGACAGQAAPMTQDKAGVVFADAEFAAWDSSDRAFDIAVMNRTANDADVMTDCDLGGRARVVGGLTLVSTVASVSDYDISFDGCSDDYSTVDGRIHLAEKKDPGGLWTQSLFGDVVVQDNNLLGGEVFSCTIGVHTIVQDMPDGQLITTDGQVCDYDAAIMFPPQTVAR